MTDRDRSQSYQVMLPPGGEGQAIEGGAPGENLFVKLHRLLVGRYKWAVLLAVIGGVAGVALGYKTTKLLYASTGLLYVEPTVRSAGDPEGKTVPPMLSAFIDSQIVYMTSDRILTRALGSESMRNAGATVEDEDLAEFRDSTQVVRPKGGLDIFVTSRRDDPRLAQASVAALIEAYQELSRKESAQQDRDRLKAAEDSEKLLESRIADITGNILNLAVEYGGPETIDAEKTVWLQLLTDASVSARRIARELEALGEDSTSAVSEDEADGPEDDPASEDREISDEEIAVSNPTMASLLLQRDMILGDIEYLTQVDGLGEQHKQVIRERRRLEVVEAGIARIRHAFLRTVSGGKVPMDEVKRQKLIKRMHEETMAFAREEATRLGKLQARIERENSDKGTYVLQLERERRLIQELKFQLKDTGRIYVRSLGLLPSAPTRDDRIRNAALMGLAFGSLGVGLVLIRSLLDRRLNTSVDVSAGLRTIRMLGLMPNIEKDMVDPEGAELARHAVHHIRTLLQISHPGDGGRTFCVTGSAPEIGKTTLSLALGHSFSATASKTLLIDCDFYGRGLSRHFNSTLYRRIRRGLGVDELADGNGHSNGNGHAAEAGGIPELLVAFEEKGRVTEQDIRELLTLVAEKIGPKKAHSEGVLRDLMILARQCIPADQRAARGGEVWDWLAETLGPFPGHIREGLFEELRRPAGFQQVMTGAPVADCVEKSNTPNLDFLPLGYGAEALAAQLSMTLVLRLLSEAQADYDTVIFDTGPVPGSLGASMVASQADGTILLVSRGQDRTDVERAVQHLQAVNARLDGLVFNRAEIRDALRVSSSHSRLSRSRSEDEYERN
jgi:polysaccharide biosynthesis transport protein